ncbi:hypothetical protein CYCD_11380 [Tenuifilaceae bacterium CYCD]|nr:hypothetical protein CYCD_11380 [Tenuifilaceae bacterium CYCD]
MKNYTKCLFLFVTIILTKAELLSSQNLECNCKKITIEDLTSNQITIDNILKRCNSDTIELIKCIKEYSGDTLKYEKALQLSNIVKELTQKTNNIKIKQEAIHYFLMNLSNANPGVASNSINVLKKFPKTYYDSSAITLINLCIIKNASSYKNIVLLAGYIGDSTTLKQINSVFPNSRNYNKTEKWATYLALARLGDNASLNYCISKINSLPLNDEVIDILYPDLIYTHRKEAYDVLVKSIFSDEKLCSSTNPNSDSKIICGYRVIELLSPQIEGFPIEVLPSGDLNIDNYPKALEITRNWFNNNKKEYVILQEKY